jgi:hypothetical protein
MSMVDHLGSNTIFRAEDGGSIFLRNAGIYGRLYYPKEQHRHLHRRENFKSHTSNNIFYKSNFLSTEPIMALNQTCVMAETLVP